MGVVEMDKYVSDSSLDKVISTLVFSELSEDEQRFALRDSHRVLKPNGKIIILDEVIPRSFEKKLLYYLIRFPLKVLTYFFTQTTTSPLRDIERKLSETHFRIEFASRFLFDSLQLTVAFKEET